MPADPDQAAEPAPPKPPKPPTGRMPPRATPPRPGLGPWLRQRRRRAILTLGLIAAVLAAAAWADHAGWFLHDGGDVRKYHGRRCRVVRVLDGDTLVVDILDRGGKPTHVRLWGLNCPEIEHPEHGGKAQPLGAEATARTRQLCENLSVRLELVPEHTRDTFGRLLAYVQLGDATWLNERLLAEGLARIDQRPGDARFDHPRMDRYRLLQQQAQHERLGLWSAAPAAGARPAGL